LATQYKNQRANLRGGGKFVGASKAQRMQAIGIELEEGYANYAKGEHDL
jgi:hypothetical protein